MKLERIIVDADFCIKIGASPKYRYLERILPELAETVYIHKKVYDEIIFPACAKEQIDVLRKQGVLEIIDENSLDPLEKVVYQNISVTCECDDKSEKTKKESRRNLFSCNGKDEIYSIFCNG